jgi:hypothetical protein
VDVFTQNVKRETRNEKRETKMTGAEIIIECLKREGVEVIFGYPGGQVLPLFDKLFDCGIRFILPRHEQAAAHAADGYARATGKTGVCIATAGRDEFDNRHRDRVHGFHSYGGHNRTSQDFRDR